MTSRAGSRTWYSGVCGAQAQGSVTCSCSPAPPPASCQDKMTESSHLCCLLTSPGVIISDWLIVSRNRPLNVVSQPPAIEASRRNGCHAQQFRGPVVRQGALDQGRKVIPKQVHVRGACRRAHGFTHAQVCQGLLKGNAAFRTGRLSSPPVLRESGHLSVTSSLFPDV